MVVFLLIVNSYSCEYAIDIIKKYSFLSNYDYHIEWAENCDYLIIEAGYEFIDFMLNNNRRIVIEKWKENYCDIIKFDYFIIIDDELYLNLLWQL